MAKFSMKKGGKEVGPASVYATPHDMKGAKVNASDTIDGNSHNSTCAGQVNMSVGNINRFGYANTAKTDGITIRGCGAATKGTKARGPMA